MTMFTVRTDRDALKIADAEREHSYSASSLPAFASAWLLRTSFAKSSCGMSSIGDSSQESLVFLASATGAHLTCFRWAVVVSDVTACLTAVDRCLRRARGVREKAK